MIGGVRVRRGGKVEVVVGQGWRGSQQIVAGHHLVVMTGTGYDVLPGDDLGEFQHDFAVFFVQQTGYDLQLGMKGAVHGRHQHLPDPVIENPPNRNHHDGGPEKEPKDEPHCYGS